MALDKPKVTFDKIIPQRGFLRYAGTLSAVDFDDYIAFTGRQTEIVLGQIRQLSYQGGTVTICYIPLFEEFIDGSDYPEVLLSQDDLVWTFALAELDEVIALRSELRTKLTRTVIL